VAGIDGTGSAEQQWSEGLHGESSSESLAAEELAPEIRRASQTCLQIGTDGVIEPQPSGTKRPTRPLIDPVEDARRDGEPILQRDPTLKSECVRNPAGGEMESGTDSAIDPCLGEGARRTKSIEVDAEPEVIALESTALDQKIAALEVDRVRSILQF